MLGALLGHTWAALFVGALAGLIWHLWHLYRLQRWLNGRHRRDPPETADATWNGLYQRIYRLGRSERKRKRKLNRALKRFRSGVAALPAGVVILNNGHQIEWCNRTAAKMLGITTPQDYGTPITSLVRTPALRQFLQRWTQASSHAANVDNDGDEITISTPRNADLRLRLVKFGKHQRLLLATDVSSARRLARARRDFVANASHELRTPLTVLIGYLEAMIDHPTFRSPPWRQPLEHMQAQSQRMQHIVTDLLLLSNLETSDEPPDEQPVAVPALIRSVAQDAAALSGQAGHCFEFDIDPQLWLNGAEQELHSVISNLLFNAVKHTPPGTQIAISWQAKDSDGDPQLRVSDNGNGIAPQHLPRLSERFYRVDRSRQRSNIAGSDTDEGGTGLGLAIVKHIMQRHHGSLQIDSQVGVGSCFCCCFPAVRRTSPDGETILTTTTDAD